MLTVVCVLNLIKRCTRLELESIFSENPNFYYCIVVLIDVCVFDFFEKLYFWKH